ncbi:hypothetical protein HQ585_18140 [candidate division KSB1 bacterium]|nr:hypothetical protein [candidate division KSB1 bacterium]
MWSIFGNRGGNIESITPEEVKEKLDIKAPIHLIDVRTEAEFHGPEGSTICA